MLGIKCGNCEINIERNDTIPNVARNNIDDEKAEEIELAIRRAVHQYVINKLSDVELKVALQRYVDKRFPSNNSYYCKE